MSPILMVRNVASYRQLSGWLGLVSLPASQVNLQQLSGPQPFYVIGLVRLQLLALSVLWLSEPEWESDAGLVARL